MEEVDEEREQCDQILNVYYRTSEKGEFYYYNVFRGEEVEEGKEVEEEVEEEGEEEEVVEVEEEMVEEVKERQEV